MNPHYTAIYNLQFYLPKFEQSHKKHLVISLIKMILDKNANQDAIIKEILAFQTDLEKSLNDIQDFEKISGCTYHYDDDLLLSIWFLGFYYSEISAVKDYKRAA